jgi:hypothetical protein
MLSMSATAPGVHLFLFDELAPVGAGFAFQHGGTETRILVQQP